MWEMLSSKQQEVIEHVKHGHTLFMTGMGGTGKSYLISLIKQHIDQTAVTALTGTAAALIQGQTLHSWAGLSVNPQTKDQLIAHVKREPRLLQNWRETRLLIIDEVSMMTGEMLNQLNYLGQKIRESEQFMGGLQTLFSGDFAQLPPPKCKEYLFESRIWKQIPYVVYLNEIYRQQDPEFQTILNEIRLGTVSVKSRELLKKRMIVPGLPKSGPIQPTILFPYKKDVNQTNEQELSRWLNSEVDRHTYEGIDEYGEIESKSLCDASAPEGFSKSDHSRKKSQIPSGIRISLREILDDSLPRELTLTVNTQVILTTNLDVEHGLCNGARGIITHFTPEGHPSIQFTTLTVVVVPRKVTLRISRYFGQRTQYPLILGWAISIHRSQGMTLDYAVADLSNCFDYGQAYVTLSRVRSLEGLWLLGLSLRSIKCHPKVIAYYQSLLQTNP